MDRDVLAVLIYPALVRRLWLEEAMSGDHRTLKGVEENLKYSRYRKRTRMSSLPFLFDRRPLFYQREKRALSYSDANK